MGLSPIQSNKQTEVKGLCTVKRNNIDLNISDGLNYGTCEQTLKSTSCVGIIIRRIITAYLPCYKQITWH